MTTTERIANAIKGILEEDRRADRERIAELERDAGSWKAWAKQSISSMESTIAELRAIDAKQTALIDYLNRQLDEAHKENARLVLERDFYKGAAPSAMQAAAPGQTSTATGGVVDHAQEMMRRGISPELARAGAAFLDAVAPVVEEQGPWVVYDDPDDLRVNPYMGLNGWGRINDGIGPFVDRSHAVAALNGWMMGGYSRAPRVITLAEARAIEAKRG